MRWNYVLLFELNWNCVTNDDFKMWQTNETNYTTRDRFRFAVFHLYTVSRHLFSSSNGNWLLFKLFGMRVLRCDFTECISISYVWCFFLFVLRAHTWIIIITIFSFGYLTCSVFFFSDFATVSSTIDIKKKLQWIVLFYWS